MMIQLAMALAIGAGAGWTIGFLMRDGHRQSPWIVVAGVSGAAIASAGRWSVGAAGIALLLTTALAGALLASLGTRLTMFAREV